MYSPLLNLIIAIIRFLDMAYLSKQSVSIKTKKKVQWRGQRTSLHHNLRRSAVDIFLESCS